MDGGDIRNFQQIVGKETVAVVEEKDGYFNLRRLGQGGERQVEQISADELFAAAGMAPAPQQQAAPAAPAAPAPAAAPQQQQFFQPQQAAPQQPFFGGQPPAGAPTFGG
jgi:hypothetical protein